MENQSINDLIKALPEYFTININERRNVGMCYINVTITDVIKSMPNHPFSFNIK